MAVWTAPADWLTDDPITANRLNTEVVENLKFLKRTPRDLVTIINGTSLTTASTTFAAIDDAQFTLELECSGGDVDLFFRGMMSNTAVGNIMAIDILMDNVTYLSSGTSTPTTSGLMFASEPVANQTVNLSFSARIENLSAGVHNFKLRWRTNAGTSTIVLAGVTTQFGAKES